MCNHTVVGRALIVAVVLSTPVACGRTELRRSATRPDPIPSAVPTAGVAVSPSFDVGAVIRQVHFAFRPDGATYRSAHATYVATVENGTVAVTPVAVGRAPAAPAQFATVVAQRVTAVDGLASPWARALANGSVAIDRGPVEEVVRNTDNGVEQSFSFTSRPTGTGDLVVRVAVGGLRYVGTTASGLHFWDDAARLGVRYGHGLWVDDAGVEVEVRARWDEENIVLTVPSDVVDGTAYPAVLDPLIGPEFGTDQPVNAPAGFDQGGRAVVYDGTNFLVVWGDSRPGSGGDIRGARVRAADGVVLDSSGIDINSAVGWQGAPAAAYDGANYFVAWKGYRSDTGYDIRGTRVSAADGSVIDAPEILISTTANEQSTHTVACDGANYLVVWTDDRSGTGGDIYGARVNAGNGAVLDASGIAISTAVGEQSRPAVTYDGANYLVVWGDTRDGANNWNIYGARVDASDGSLLDTSGIAISTAVGEQSRPAVAYDGANYLVVWSDGRTATSVDIYGARVAATDGAVVDSGGIVISEAADLQLNPAVAYDGADYLVVWEDHRSGTDYDIYGTRVDPSDGSVLDPTGIAVSTAPSNQYGPGVAFGSSDYLVVWTDTRSGMDYDVYGTRVSATAGSVVDPSSIAIARATNFQQFPAVAYGGSSYLIVWQDNRSGVDYDIYGVRVDATDGAVLDSSGIAISTATNDQQHPAVACDGTNYFVVWEDARSGTPSGIYGARVRIADGTVLDATGIPIATGAGWKYQPAIATDEIGYLVVWEDTRSGDVDIYGARVQAADGTVLDASGIVVATGGSDQYAPAVAYDATNYFVVWTDYAWDASVHGARVRASDGSVLDAPGIAIASGVDEQAVPTLACDGASCLVAWTEYHTGTGNDVFGIRLSTADASALDSTKIPIAAVSNHQDHPAVVYDGTRYVVLWQDARSGTYHFYGARVDGADGTVLDASGFAVSEEPVYEANIAVAAAAPGHLLATYERADPVLDVSIRAKARLLVTTLPLGEECSRAVDCASGFCADGVCCDVTCGGSDPSDCEACSITAGATVNGACGPRSDGATCSDNSACTTADTCNSGTCQSGSTLECDDSNVCTDDACDTTLGCVHANNTASCSDGDACTQNDVCTSGVCQSGVATVCVAVDACHDAGTCDPMTGLCSTPPKTTDTDEDGTPDCADQCPGADDSIDTNANDVPDGCETTSPDTGSVARHGGCNCNSGQPGMVGLWVASVWLIWRRRRREQRARSIPFHSPHRSTILPARAFRVSMSR